MPRILEDVDRKTELGDWLNEPVVHYSTGMRARLAFVVATSIAADVLLWTNFRVLAILLFESKR